MRKQMRPILAIATACFRADPARTIGSLAFRILGMAGPVAYATFLKEFVDAAGASDEGRLRVLAVWMALSVAALTACDRFGWQLGRILEEKTAHLIDREVISLVAGLPGIEHHERAEHLDKIEHLRHEHWLLSMAVPALISAAALWVQVMVTVAVLARVDARLLALPVLALPSVWAAARAERIRYAYLDAARPHWRTRDMLVELATQPASAKELRVFGLRDEILRRHHDACQFLIDGERDHRLAGAKLVLAARLVFSAGYVLAILAVASRVGTGHTVGQVVLTVTLASQVMQQLAMAAGNVNWVAWTMTAVRRYVWLLDFAESSRQALRRDAPLVAVPPRLSDGIRFTGVRFAYPGTEHEVLHGVDLHVPAGSTLAIVGDNGAGKTTLVKLLTRMYEPSGGTITLDGVDLRDLDVEEWRQRTAAAFQDHARLELIAQQAVGVGDVGRVDDEVAAIAALDRGGSLDVLDALPAGLQTQLGAAWDGGVDLSGGQWQRLAIGRAMMREQPLLLVLDEPTAALDAETEHRLFTRYAEAAREAARAMGTVTILVSHRFSTVRMADEIVVVSGGRIAEHGSHADLMTRNGIYAELYEMQAAAYRS
ncbi:MAG TPA: ABC transporter ATP-binding protein [Acidimicrobiales bacterium]|nr:ABC transporter ATP-binding protein [Acidimicrobiales bacterium]